MAHLVDDPRRARSGASVGQCGGNPRRFGRSRGWERTTRRTGRPDALSASLPFEIDELTLEATADPAGVAPVVTPIGTPVRMRRAHPLLYSIATLTPSALPARR